MANRFYGSYRATAKAGKKGPRGIARRVRADKREEAETRNLATPAHKRKAYRRRKAGGK